MNDHADMLTQSVDRLFGDIVPAGAATEAWSAIEQLGIPALFMPQADGGMEGSWADAGIVFRLAGYHALPLPVGETMVARHLLAAAGADLPEGAVMIGRGRGRLRSGGHFSGSIDAASPECSGAPMLASVASEQGTTCILIDPASASRREAPVNASTEPRYRFAFEDAACLAFDPDAVDPEALLLAGAFLRTAQIGGALAACLDSSVRYAGERSQFGRELRKFQAIQHQIALLAEEAAAIASAAASAAAALDRGEAGFEIACAKLRANQATGASALIAHQIHGAIGITEEYGLHRLTGRLWAWRSEFGNDRFWAERLGAFMLSADSPSPWNVLTARGVP